MAFLHKYLIFLGTVVIILTYVQGQPPLEFTSTFKDVITERNKVLALPCSAVTQAEFQPITYTWRKDGAPINGDARCNISADGTLNIKRVKNSQKVTDNGVYDCLATDTFGTIQSPKFQVTVSGHGFVKAVVRL
ncbi:unnamed protein product [Owenia fusiformis]|uniref:Uncharacterized protein n=1 Tax=Owenia fusiformis TaxID=6347 RepID=A0A8J1Y3K3_OWEFU|nr:unnamed protein product [Owenia fusiformis]